MSWDEIMKPQTGLDVAGGRKEGKDVEGTDARVTIGFRWMNIRPASLKYN